MTTDHQWDQNPPTSNTDESAKTLTPTQLNAASAEQAKLGAADAKRGEAAFNNLSPNNSVAGQLAAYSNQTGATKKTPTPGRIAAKVQGKGKK